MSSYNEASKKPYADRSGDCASPTKPKEEIGILARTCDNTVYLDNLIEIAQHIASKLGCQLQGDDTSKDKVQPTSSVRIKLIEASDQLVTLNNLLSIIDKTI